MSKSSTTKKVIVRASYIAIDANGARWCFENKPQLEGQQWTPDTGEFHYLGDVTLEYLKSNPWYNSLKKLG